MRAERGPWLLAAAALFVVVWGSRAPPGHQVPPVCLRAARVGEQVLCDGELEIVEVCGRVYRLRAGDAIDPRTCDLGRMSSDELALLQVPIDPNHDGIGDLESLPGIGPTLAKRIVLGRPYGGPEALLEVKGVGPHTLERIRPRLVFADPQP